MSEPMRNVVEPTTLLPYPFCGGRVSRKNLWADGRGFYIECPDCRARGGSRPGTDGAIAAWNRRADHD